MECAIGKLAAAALALFEQSASEAELNAFGLRLADIEEPTFSVWADNWPAVQLFLSVVTQWRISMGVQVGLDYTAVKAVMDMQGVAQSERAGLLQDLREMEISVLNHWAAERSKNG